MVGDYVVFLLAAWSLEVRGDSYLGHQSYWINAMTDTASTTEELRKMCEETLTDSCYEPLTSSNYVKWATRAKQNARALLSRLEADTAPQPIETAPHDCVIIVFNENQAASVQWEDFPGQGHGWRHSHDGWLTEFTPTHWIPFPLDAPQPTEAETEAKYPWEPISTIPDCNDLMWFRKENVIDGPRECSFDDADYWDFWCYAVAPPFSAPQPTLAAPLVTEDELADIIEKCARDVLFNGGGNIINAEIFKEAATSILSRLSAPAPVGSASPGHLIVHAFF